ncbi:MAG: hypothetical protein Kow00109_23240 [Acidobacteriota bacterium]
MEVRRSIVLYAVILVAVAVAFFAGLELGRQGAAPPETPPDESSLGRRPVAPSAAQVLPADEGESNPPLTSRGPASEAEDSSAPAPRVEITGGGLAVSGPPPAASSSRPATQLPAQTPQGARTEEVASRVALPYTIQVAAHSSEKEAQATLTRLQAKNFAGRIRAPRPGDRDQFYRVWVGQFASPEAARAMEKQLKDAGFPTFVRRID